MVKGWAVERASAFLQALPDADYCLSAGGDMTCHSRDADDPWQIGIEDPHDTSRVLAVVPVARSGREARAVLDNLAQFRFHSAWRGAARRRAAVTP